MTKYLNHQIGLPYWNGFAESGTWTTTVSSNVPIVTRTASAATEYYNFPIPLAAPTTSARGVKLKAIRVTYTIASADTAADTLEFHIIRTTLGAHGSATTGAIIAGDADSDYDSNHDTSAERLTAGTRTATITIPLIEQKYSATNENYFVRIKIIDASSANLAFVLTGAVAIFDNNSLY